MLCESNLFMVLLVLTLLSTICLVFLISIIATTIPFVLARTQDTYLSLNILGK